jgi:uncharacterized iron-regulated membrane protein
MIGEDQFNVSILPRDAAHPPGFNHLPVDPYTGRELGRPRHGDVTEGAINILPLVSRLNRDLALGPDGALAPGIVALLWTIDTISSTFLTLPRKRPPFPAPLRRCPRNQEDEKYFPAKL